MSYLFPTDTSKGFDRKVIRITQRHLLHVLQQDTLTNVAHPDWMQHMRSTLCMIGADGYTSKQLVEVMNMTRTPQWFEPLRALILEYHTRQIKNRGDVVERALVITSPNEKDHEEERLHLHKTLNIVATVLLSLTIVFTSIWVLTLLGRIVVSCL